MMDYFQSVIIVADKSISNDFLSHLSAYSFIFNLYVMQKTTLLNKLIANAPLVLYSVYQLHFFNRSFSVLNYL